ncbi:MAG: hypothetical protein ACKPKO_42205, partial [Candidatus Fonsibacter sp.]
GIMVTASHNPANDNGYKVYLGKTVDGIRFNGSQIISPIDKEIAKLMQAVNFPIRKLSNYVPLITQLKLLIYLPQTALLRQNYRKNLNLKLFIHLYMVLAQNYF